MDGKPAVKIPAIIQSHCSSHVHGGWFFLCSPATQN